MSVLLREAGLVSSDLVADFEGIEVAGPVDVNDVKSDAEHDLQPAEAASFLQWVVPFK